MIAGYEVMVMVRKGPISAIPANKMPAQTLFSPLCSEALPNVADPEGQIICVQNLQQNRGFGGSYSGQWEAQGAAAS